MFVRRTFSLVSVSAASILFGLVTFEQSAAQDVRHICSEKYQSAKAAGTLNDETWPQFYSRCTTEAKANAAAAEATAAPPLDIRHICSEKYQAIAALFIIVLNAVATFAILKIIGMFVPLRMDEKSLQIGDMHVHGEEA